MSDFIDSITNDIMWADLATRWQIRGCWEWEIRDLEDHYEIKLPSLYRSFLKRMGRGAGKFGQGLDMFFSRLFNNRKALEEVLELDGYPFTLTPTEFVFYSGQGYHFYYFETRPLVDDPPVYEYMEGSLQSRLVNTSFSDFLRSLAEDQIRGWAT